MGIDAIIKWAIIGVFVLFLVVGFLMGLIRGIKRQGVHIAFVVLSLINGLKSHISSLYLESPIIIVFKSVSGSKTCNCKAKLADIL